MAYILVTIAYILGLLVGVLICRFWDHMKKPKTVGSLRVDRTDPDGPYLFLELEDSDGMGKIMNQKEVIFKVKIRD